MSGVDADGLQLWVPFVRFVTVRLRATVGGTLRHRSLDVTRGHRKLLWVALRALEALLRCWFGVMRRDPFVFGVQTPRHATSEELSRLGVVADSARK